jgi:hypothetical protein
MRAKRAFYAILFTVMFLGLVAAGSNPTERLQGALTQLCDALNGLLPIAAMLMVLLSAVIYATGQMMGAETRARANVWATSCLTGALIGLLIATIAPTILGLLLNNGGPIACG